MTEASTVSVPDVRLLDDFAAIGSARWDALLATGPTDAPFLTHAWQRLWWTAFGDEQLLIACVERDGSPVAIAPLFAVEGSVSLVGSGNSDFLDFVGPADLQALAAMLRAACGAAHGFSGIELYHLPAGSPTTRLLPGVAARLGLQLEREEAPGAPYADLTNLDLLESLTARRSTRKEEARMRRAGELCVRVAAPEELEALVELFLAQHAARWVPAGQRSFDRRGSREFVRAAVATGGREGWARVTLLEWEHRPVAIDISLIRSATQLSWLVSRDPSIQEHSPGRVLRAHVVRQAAEAGVRRFEFGLGEEDYKLRDASGVTRLNNWFLYE